MVKEQIYSYFPLFYKNYTNLIDDADLISSASMTSKGQLER